MLIVSRTFNGRKNQTPLFLVNQKLKYPSDVMFPKLPQESVEGSSLGMKMNSKVTTSLHSQQAVHLHSKPQTNRSCHE